MTVSVHSELYCFSTFTIWWILRVFVHRKSVPCTLHFKEFCFVTNKLITLFLSPGFPCSRLNQLIIRQGLLILVAISKACIWNIFYFTQTFTLGQGPATYYSTGIRQGLWLPVKFWQEQGSVTIDLYSTAWEYIFYTWIQPFYPNTNSFLTPRHIISSQTRFTLPTENLISLRFIIVAHTRHNIFGGSVGTNFFKSQCSDTNSTSQFYKTMFSFLQWRLCWSIIFICVSTWHV